MLIVQLARIEHRVEGEPALLRRNVLIHAPPAHVVNDDVRLVDDLGLNKLLEHVLERDDADDADRRLRAREGGLGAILGHLRLVIGIDVSCRALRRRAAPLDECQVRRAARKVFK